MDIEKKDLIARIVDIEQRMFLSVPAAEPCFCREDLPAFRSHRTAQFMAWSPETLRSYLEGLHEAERSGRNLMTLKYARMDGQIPMSRENPLIEKITAAQLGWQAEMHRRYPRLMARGRPVGSEQDGDWVVSFETYLRAELETYSDETLTHLWRDVSKMASEKINMSEVIYRHLVQEAGYADIEAAEAPARR